MAAVTDLVLLARQPSWVAVELPVFQAVTATILHAPLVTDRACGDTPVELAIDWQGLDGVDDLEVAPATMTIAPPSSAAPAVNLGEVTHRLSNGMLEVDVPAGRRVRRLQFRCEDPEEGHLRNGLVHEDEVLTSAPRSGRRLAVTTVQADGSFFAPAVTVPHVCASGQRGAMFVGGSYENGVLTLPDVAGPTLRVALVSGDAPEFPTTHALAVHRVTAWAAPTPRDLQVAGPDGAVLWSFPGELPAGTPASSVDLAVGVAAALRARLGAGEPLTGAVTLTARDEATVGLALPTVAGALLRTIPGTTRAVLAGRPAPVSLDGGPLPDEEPTDAVADVRVTYDGVRLAEVSDLLPTSRTLAGVVVRDEPVRRALPPQALRGQQVARVGVIGRAVDVAELSVQLVDASPGADHAPLADPSVVTVEGGRGPGDVDVVWVTLPEPVSVTTPVAVQVTATTGVFRWVAEPDPLVRLAVVDPDSGGRPVLLADQPLVTLDEPTLVVERASLPGGPFRGGTGEAAGTLTFASPLFCTLELTDVTLRYARGGS